MEINNKATKPQTFKDFPALEMALLIVPILALAVYGVLVFAFDRHPAAPFIEPKRVLALHIASIACGLPSPPFTIWPSSFAVQEMKIQIACTNRLERSSGR